MGFCGSSPAQHEDLDHDTYPPGHSVLTPEIDLQLQSSRLEIPKEYDRVRDLTLKLPPGFTANVFAGEELASGTYVYELLAGERHRTRKLVLLR